MPARFARKALLPLLLAASASLGGCYYTPYPGYAYGYGQPGYGYPGTGYAAAYPGYGYAAAYPGYYGASPCVGAVVIGGGRYYR